ncbi:MAG: YdeI/OmpD-associated family protein, partial [bacterium]|nr:YdeI/OmpD-associated family protein [bacterium]
MPNEAPTVSDYIARTTRWPGEIRKLRSVLLDCGLEEGLKWGKPCYMIDGRNVAIIQAFKEYCALMFFKGVLLEDTHGRLRSQGPNSRSAMRLEFGNEREITKSVVRDYVRQAVRIEREGLRVEHSDEDLELPEELRERLRADRALAKAFESLTPGRQRGYTLHIGGAKQSKTRASRVEKCIPAS